MPVPKGTRFFVVRGKRGKNKGRKIRIATFRGKTIEAKVLPKKKKK